MGQNLLYKYFDEIAVGERLISRGRTITETDVVNWCALTGDWHALHSDRHYAARSQFGQRIAPGLLVYAVGAGLGVPADAHPIIANYGTDRLRFLAPTLIGDTVHLEAEVTDKRLRESRRDGIVSLDWNVVNQNDVAVLASQLNILIARSPDSSQA